MANEGEYYDKNRTGYYPGGSESVYPDHNMAGEYQASGVPFVFYKAVTADGSNDRMITLTLPYVSRWIILSAVQGSGSTARIGFGDYSSSKGIRGANYVTPAIITALKVPLELKCKKIKIWLPSTQTITINLVAGLTNVRDFPSMDGADIVGVTQEAAVTKTSAKAGQVAIYTVENRA